MFKMLLLHRTVIMIFSAIFSRQINIMKNKGQQISCLCPKSNFKYQFCICKAGRNPMTTSSQFYSFFDLNRIFFISFKFVVTFDANFEHSEF